MNITQHPLHKLEAWLSERIIGQAQLNQQIADRTARRWASIGGRRPGTGKDQGRAQSCRRRGRRFSAHPVHSGSAAQRCHRHRRLPTGNRRIQVHPRADFHNLVLADEINRAPAKVQSALLEAMAERQVSVGGKTIPLPPMFLVMATQNPIEQEGTYPLPEAQLDRFLLHVEVGYPAPEAEREILRLAREELEAEPVAPEQLSQESIFAARESCETCTRQKR